MYRYNMLVFPSPNPDVRCAQTQLLSSLATSQSLVQPAACTRAVETELSARVSGTSGSTLR